MLPVGQGLITAVGWQDALLWMALGIAFIIPLSAAVTGTSARGGGVEQSLRQALAEAMRTPSFHFLFWSFFVCGFQTAFIMLYLSAFVVDSGMSANIGMTAVAMIGLFNIFGSFLEGAMRNPSAAQGQFGNLIFGFAVTEALGIFSLLIALLLLFAV